MSLTVLAGVLPILALLALSPAPGLSQTHTKVDSLHRGCAERLESTLAQYSNASAAVEGCDQACLQRCGAVLQSAIGSEQVENCPEQADITRCFQVYEDQWVDYAKKCALFSYDSKALSAEGEGRRRLFSHKEAVEELQAQITQPESTFDGCFPAFEGPEDFEAYVQGLWWDGKYGRKSNTVGIILSVVFWVGLLGVGYTL